MQLAKQESLMQRENKNSFPKLHGKTFFSNETKEIHRTRESFLLRSKVNCTGGENKFPLKLTRAKNSLKISLGKIYKQTPWQLFSASLTAKAPEMKALSHWRSLFKVSIIKNFLLKNAQFNFSSRFPRDVIDSALMNSSNSIEPSCDCFVYAWEEEEEKKGKDKFIFVGLWK